MPKLIGLGVFSYWSDKEKEVNDTERHRMFKAELYPYLKDGHKAFTDRVVMFKINHPELFEEETSSEEDL